MNCEDEHAAAKYNFNKVVDRLLKTARQSGRHSIGAVFSTNYMADVLNKKAADVKA